MNISSEVRVVVLVPVSSGHWARGGVRPGQVASPSNGETCRTNNYVNTLHPEHAAPFWIYIKTTLLLADF